MSRRVCVVTGGRSDYGLLKPILKEIRRSNDLNLQLVATTMHLSHEFGLTYQQIEEDGFEIHEKIDNLLKIDSRSAIAKSSAKLTDLIADCFERLSPDIVLLLGDRFETHAAATSALLMNIPIAHIHGGEVTQGAVDEQLRHAITKMSFLHFCSTDAYRKRVIQMGEDSSKVFNCGAPGIDNIVNKDLLTKGELSSQIGWTLPEEFALFTYHPTTLEDSNLNQDLDRIFNVLTESNMGVLFTYANSDFGGEIINNRIEDFCKINPAKYHVVKSLGQLRYLSAMKYADLLIGNTSSGIIEAASFGKPVVNIGNRQLGRVRNENVIDCTIQELKESLKIALSEDFLIKCTSQKNVYGNGSASKCIVRELLRQPLTVVKKFVDLK